MENEIIQKQINIPDMGGIFGTSEKFELALKMAASLSKSTMIPKEFQGNVSNCILAVDIAERVKMSPFMVMQNIYIVYGKPSWSSQFIGALINSSRRYKEPIHYKMNDEKTSCYAWSIDQNGNKVVGPIVIIQMAKNEGWYDKNGSKWKTMPEIMLRYRALSFFGRIHCGDLLMGMYTNEEVIEMNNNMEFIDNEINEKANKGNEICFENEKSIENLSDDAKTNNKPTVIDNQLKFEAEF